MQTEKPIQGPPAPRQRVALSVPFVLMAILFNVCLIASNLFETKIFTAGMLTLTGGVIIFPVSYILNDCIVEVWGYRKARLVIWSGFAMNFFVVAMAQIVRVLPAAGFWDGGEHFDYIFGMAPRVTLASLLAFLSGSTVNAYIMSRMKVASHGRRFSFRAVVSSVAGETVDSLVFFPMALGGIVPWDNLWLMVCWQILVKTLYEIVVLPVTKRVVRYVKRTEGVDVYDRGISYNILKVS